MSIHGVRGGKPLTAPTDGISFGRWNWRQKHVAGLKAKLQRTDGADVPSAYSVGWRRSVGPQLSQSPSSEEATAMNSPLRALTACLGVLLYICVCNATSSGETAAEAFSPPSGADPSVASAQTVVIPGPLRSFLRMAAISQKVPSEKVLPLLARNVITQGYDNGRPTEYLILVDRYLHQARELQALADSNGVIRIQDCEHAGSLLPILGYRLTQPCGQKGAFL